MVLFENNFVVDSRDVSLEFEIPYFHHTYGFAPPSLKFWLQLMACLVIQTTISFTFILLAWFLVVGNRNNSFGFSVCFGFLFPALLIIPFFLVPYLEIQNTVFAAPLLVHAPANALRMIEIFYATSPPFAEKSLLNFIVYHSSPIAFRFHSETEAPIKGTRQEIIGKAAKVIPSLCLTTIVVNILIQTNYRPFGYPELDTFLDYFKWRHLGNNLFGAYLAGTCLESGTLIFGIVITLLTGISTIELNDSPFTKSTSVADFWGRRWNRQIGTILKTGIFKPCRKNGISRLSSALATFLVSSLLHEYVIFAGVTAVANKSRPIYVPNYGRQSAFFMWNGVMLVLEILVMSTSFKSIWSRIPPFVKTFFIVMTSLPIAQWFLDDFTGAGLFQDFAVALPRITRI